MIFGKITRDKAWEMYSKYIRLKVGKCEYCKTLYKGGIGLHAHHYFSRDHENVRYDEENIVCLCPYHHDYFGKNPHVQVEFMQKRLGDRYDILVVKANTYKKKDRKMAYIIAKALYDNLVKGGDV